MSVVPLALLCTLSLFALRASNSSPCALDDASGTGVLLQLGRAVSTNPIPNVEVVLSALWAEELGLLGSAEFCKRHLVELTASDKQVLVVNLDGTGAGTRRW